MDSGRDVFFTHDAGCCTITPKTRAEIEIHRRVGKFENDAKIGVSFSQTGENVRPRDFQHEFLQPLELE